MRRRFREALGVFSVSAIDLFACALGAFILISLILFPFFPNRDLRSEVDSLRAAINSSNREFESLTDQLDAAKRDETNALKRADQLARQLRGAALIGIEPTTSSFHIMLDLSGSMQDHVDLIDRMVSTVVERLTEDDSLRISTFQGQATDPILQFWPSATGFKKGMGDAEKAAASAFVDSVLGDTGGNTPTFEALELALRSGEQSTIILFTDGAPTNDDRGLTRGEIITRIADLTSKNLSLHQINIVALGNFSQNEVGSVAELARNNKGAFVVLP